MKLKLIGGATLWQYGFLPLSIQHSSIVNQVGQYLPSSLFEAKDYWDCSVMIGFFLLVIWFFPATIEFLYNQSVKFWLSLVLGNADDDILTNTSSNLPMNATLEHWIISKVSMALTFFQPVFIDLPKMCLISGHFSRSPQTENNATKSCI